MHSRALTRSGPCWLLLLILLPPPGHGQERLPRLSIATWGGAYEAAQREALFAPYEHSHQVHIDTLPYVGGIDILDTSAPPMLVDMIQSDAILACRQGRLRRLEELLSEEELGGVGPAGTHWLGALARIILGRHSSDLLPGSLTPCSIAHSSYATVVAYHDEAFPGLKPGSIGDFFDIERFPGRRALRNSPDAVLEWALLAEGIPAAQVHDLLSTDRGLRLAFERLERLRGHIVWYERPDEAISLLEQHQVVMSAGYNGRFFAAQQRGLPLIMLWDGQLIDLATWVIPATTVGEEAELASQFIRFAMQPARQASLAEHIPYGPTRRSALARIGVNPHTGIPMLPHLPSARHHLEGALFRDADWYANTEALRQQRFRQWREQQP